MMSLNTLNVAHLTFPGPETRVYQNEFQTFPRADSMVGQRELNTQFNTEALQVYHGS